MKSRLIVLCIVLTLFQLTISPTFAVAEDDMPAYARYVWKISESTTIYQDNGDGTRTANGTIAGGTYVHIDHTFEGQDDHVKYASIVAMDGTKGEVRSSKLVSAMVWIGNDSYHELYLKEHGMPGASGNMPLDPEERAPSGSQAIGNTNQMTSEQAQIDLSTSPASLEITLKAKLRRVSGHEAPEDLLVAFVYAPNSGKASLREAADNDSKVLSQCHSGTVVVVLEIGKTHSLVEVDGQVSGGNHNSFERLHFLEDNVLNGVFHFVNRP